MPESASPNGAPQKRARVRKSTSKKKVPAEKAVAEKAVAENAVTEQAAAAKPSPQSVTPPAPQPASVVAAPAVAETSRPIAGQVEVVVTALDRRTMIATAAYYRAERRQFASGHELEDWLAAEADVEALVRKQAEAARRNARSA